MKINQKGFGAMEVLIVLIVISLIGGIGYLTYQNQQDKKERENLALEIENLKNKDTKSQGSSDSSGELTEDQKILRAAGCEDNDPYCKIEDKRSSVAYVGAGDELGGGARVFVAKQDNGEWTEIYSGNGDMPSGLQEQYSLPDEWMPPEFIPVQ